MHVKMKKNSIKSSEKNELKYNYVHKPNHYQIFSVDDLKNLVERNQGIDVIAIANAVGLDKDAYMFNVLKYTLRTNKPNEPRDRDVQKIKEYCDIWLNNYNYDCKNSKNDFDTKDE